MVLLSPEDFKEAFIEDFIVTLVDVRVDDNRRYLKFVLTFEDVSPSVFSIEPFERSVSTEDFTPEGWNNVLVDMVQDLHDWLDILYMSVNEGVFKRIDDLNYTTLFA